MRNKNINQFAESNGGRKIWRDGEKIKLCWFPIDFHADRGPGHHCSCGFGCATIIIYTGVPICWRRFIHIQDRMLEPASGRCKHASRGRERGKRKKGNCCLNRSNSSSGTRMRVGHINAPLRMQFAMAIATCRRTGHGVALPIGGFSDREGKLLLPGACRCDLPTGTREHHAS